MARKGKRKKRRPKRSVGETQIEKVFRKMKYKVFSEYKIKNFSYDLYIPDLNLLIEYNGTRWHYDPRFYDAHYYDEFKERYVFEKWEADKYKEHIATAKGYEYLIIWQYDWMKLKNRRTFIEKILKERGFL